MQLETQVCSLELAKKLKELGVKQESQLYWQTPGTEYVDRHFEPLVDLSSEDSEDWDDDAEHYSAFTVAELGEMLPWQYSTSSRREKGWYICGERSANSSGYSTSQQADTEADARAKMLIYLLENDFLGKAAPTSTEA